MVKHHKKAKKGVRVNPEFLGFRHPGAVRVHEMDPEVLLGLPHDRLAGRRLAQSDHCLNLLRQYLSPRVSDPEDLERIHKELRELLYAHPWLHGHHAQDLKDAGLEALLRRAD